ncbi:Protein MAIN-LIKE 2 [Glycine soja]
MVRTRGLGRALDRVIGRALGREVSGDADEGPSGEGPQHMHAAPVNEDVQHVNHANERFMNSLEKQLLMMYLLMSRVFQAGLMTQRPKLKLSSHGRKVEKFGMPAPKIEGLVRWHKETTSFHLLVGEVIITLDDVASLLHLPITGAFHNFEALHVDKVVLLLVELLEVSLEEARAETIQYHEAYVRLSWLRDIYLSKCDATLWTSDTHIHVVFLDTFRDLMQSGSYACGAVALVHMYENLNDCWIYEHFPFVAYSIVVEDYHERKPPVCRWKSGKALPVLTYHKRLDRLMSNVTCWIPYGDHRAFREFEIISLFSRHIRWGPSIIIHRPERVVRQFGPFLHTLLLLLYVLKTSMIDGFSFLNTLHQLVRYVLRLDSLHLAQPGDPPRHSPMVHNNTFVEPDVPQHPMVATIMDKALADAHVDVDQTQHAVACLSIVERLERLLNLKIVIEGTKAYTVIEDYLRIA